MRKYFSFYLKRVVAGNLSGSSRSSLKKFIREQATEFSRRRIPGILVFVA